MGCAERAIYIYRWCKRGGGSGVGFSAGERGCQRVRRRGRGGSRGSGGGGGVERLGQAAHRRLGRLGWHRRLPARGMAPCRCGTRPAGRQVDALVSCVVAALRGESGVTVLICGRHYCSMCILQVNSTPRQVNLVLVDVANLNCKSKRIEQYGILASTTSIIIHHLFLRKKNTNF